MVYVTYCSLLFGAGAKIKEIQVRLCHTDIETILNTYANVTVKVKEDAIQKFETYLSI